MTKIEEIRTIVFQYLIEVYESEKEKTLEFFFTLERGQGFLHSSGIYDEIGNKEALTILFYGNWKGSEIAYITIDEDKNTYLTGTFNGEGRGDSATMEAGRKLNSYFSENLSRDKKLAQKDGMETFGEFIYTYKFTQDFDYKANIEYFLKNFKPVIDNIIHGIRSKSSYYFYNQAQFDEYLKREPCYFSINIEKLRHNIRLTALRILDFQGINQIAIKDLPPTARWIVLTGENGYGKTSVLQAIAAGLYGNFDESGRQLVSPSSYVGVEYFDDLEIIENNSRLSRVDASGRKLNSYLATYGSSRLQMSAFTTNDKIEEQIPATYSLFNDDGVLLNIEQLLKETYISSRPFYDQLVTLFKELIPSLHEIKIDVENKLNEIWYVEKDGEGFPINDGLRFKNLATGFKNIIAMIGDLVYRLSIRQQVNNLKDLEGIVIIDEIELHLHPIYQKLLPEVLSNQFPNLQFIVSTHSPIPLLGIPKNVGVKILQVSRSKEMGIELKLLDVDFSVLTPNAILTSPIFGFSDLIPESKSNSQMIRTEDTFDDIEKQNILDEQIKNYLSPENQKKLLEIIKK